MSDVMDGRMTVQRDDDFVVFLIGMRINRWWKVHKWLPVAMAMPRMLAELSRRPELGLLKFHVWFARTIIVVQYWRSVDELNAYAKSRDLEHLPAWTAFNRAVGGNGDVGIFHETYRVRPGDFECIYANMPPFGLGAIAGLVPARRRLTTAHDRMTGGSLADTPSPT
jgi:hypothetical protein